MLIALSSRKKTLTTFRKSALPKVYFATAKRGKHRLINLYTSSFFGRMWGRLELSINGFFFIPPGAQVQCTLNTFSPPAPPFPLPPPRTSTAPHLRNRTPVLRVRRWRRSPPPRRRSSRRSPTPRRSRRTAGRCWPPCRTRCSRSSQSCSRRAKEGDGLENIQVSIRAKLSKVQFLAADSFAAGAPFGE